MSRPSKHTAREWLSIMAEAAEEGETIFPDEALPRRAAIEDARDYLDKAEEGPWIVEHSFDGSIVLSIHLDVRGAKRFYVFEGDSFCTVREAGPGNAARAPIAHFPV